MMSTRKTLALVAALLVVLCGNSPAYHVHFIHQSTGDNWLKDYDEYDPNWGGGNLRADLESDGHVVTDNWYWDDNAPYCDWDPDYQGLCSLFLNDGARLPAEAQEADIIIIKSCFYPTEYLTSDEVLNGWISHSISDIIEGYLNNHPEQHLIYCSSMPHHRDGENCPPTGVRARGRAWGEWLEDTSSGPLSYATYNNVTGFSAFGLTARPTGEAHENTLRAEYEIFDPGPDNHMNREGNVACAAQVRILVNAVEPAGASDPRGLPGTVSLELSPNPCSQVVQIDCSLLSNPGASVSVYDATGRCVAALAGEHSGRALWHLRNTQGRSVAPGTYFVVVTDGEAESGRRVVLTR
jgi:hypothetical protein